MKRKDRYINEDKKRQYRNMTLEDAWRLFAVYDHNASLTSKRFSKTRRWILILSVFATFLALGYQILSTQEQTQDLKTLNSILRVFVILLPITISALLTISSKFERGVSWVLLRGSAEAIKHEIFRFRAHVEIYSDENTRKESREVKMARKIKSINERLMKTEVNQSGLQPYNKQLPPPMYLASEEDDGFSYLTPSKYIEFRVENQMNFYKKRTAELDKNIRNLHYRIIFFGALGTLLAALGLEVWIAATTSIVAAITSYIEYNQYEATLKSYNMSAMDLESIRIWWRALPANTKISQSIYDKLVSSAEGVMQAESQRWIQNMQDALKELDEETQATSAKTSSPSVIEETQAPSTKTSSPSALPQVPEDEGLTPVDLTPADLISGNWRGSDFPQVETPPPPIDKPEPGHFDLSSEDLEDINEILITDIGKGDFFVDDRVQDTSLLDEEFDDDMPDDTDLPFGDIDLNDDDIEVDDFVPGKVPSEDKSDYGSDTGDESPDGK